MYGKFPAINKLKVAPTGDVPNFVNLKDVISPSGLYDKFSLGSSRGFACVCFTAAINIHLGGEKLISKNVMNEFYHNLSMTNDEMFVKLDPIKRLNKDLKNLLIGEI